MPLKDVRRRLRPVASANTAVGASTRDRILAEAERVFAAFSYDGASIRQIADAADVPVALVSYHFGSKDGLYRAIFERRVPTIVEQRLAGLAIARSELDPERRLELIIKALVVPMLLLRSREDNPSYGRLVSHEITDPHSEARGIIRDLVDPIARTVMDALASALPDRSVQDICWAYQFMLGAMVMIMTDNGRIARLSDGCCRPEDEASAIAHMVSFLVAGLRYGTPVASRTADPTAGRELAKAP